MRGKLLAAIGCALACTVATPASAEWIHHLSRDQVSNEEISNIQNWINNTCKPDEMGAITGFVSQAGAGASYNLYLFCEKGTGKLGPVVLAKHNWADNVKVFLRNALTGRPLASVVGFYDGVETDVVFVLYPQ